MGRSPVWLRLLGRRPTSLFLAFAAGPAGLGGTGAVVAQDWTTRPEYQIDPPEGGTGEFGRSSMLRVGRSGTRIVVWDAGAARHDAGSRILVFSPDGGLLLRMEPDDLPGGPGSPVGVRAGASSFWVRYPGRSIRFSYDSGNPGETVVFPRELGRVLPLAGGGFLGLSRRSAVAGAQVVVRLADADGERISDTIAVLDVRNSILTIALGDLRRGLTRSHESQPFADNDLTWMDEEAGSVGIVRRSGPPGVAEVFEITASGDTAWHRHLQLSAVPVRADRLEREITDKVDDLRAQAQSYGLTEAQLWTMVEEALHVPSHLPSVSAVVATASGEVWLRTREVEDSMAVWYAIPRVDKVSVTRRVLLPISFRLNDASSDHVWGFSELSPESGRILVGLRLVRRVDGMGWFRAVDANRTNDIVRGVETDYGYIEVTLPD